jgi:deazaflavin-dependent oxidoreductase (nitroreductase family)
VSAQRLTIMLTTRGAQSGKIRTCELYAFPVEDGLLVVGSRGGSARHPGWAYNLAADPTATVQHGKVTTQMTAREVTDPTERERLWAIAAERFPLYERYRTKTTRLIRLFVLQPQAPTEA